ncbi:MAG: monovalent cation/H(+) antiporter subunit G [Bdellovibrionales bacterium]|nr:monovalent cation/H(+) antiporter subunit G [Bdellovibrionales bacterium]
MINTILNILIVVCFLLGLLFFFGTAVGLIRFPDFYTRCHAASKGDTLSSFFLLLGCAFYSLHELSLISVLLCLKLSFIIIFVFISTPTSAHALLQAGYLSGALPWQRDMEELPEEEID